MTTLQKLYDRRAQLVAGLRENLAAAEKSGRVLTDDEKRRDDAGQADLAKLNEEIGTLEAARETERATVLARFRGETPPGRRGVKWADLWGPEAAANTAGFGSFAEFAGLIHAGLGDPRLKATGTIGTPSSGGFLVPDQHLSLILDGAVDAEIVRPRAQVFGMTANTLKVGGLVNPDASSGSVYGFAGGFTAEAAEIDVSTVPFAGLTLEANKLALLAQFSNELAADGQGFDAQIQRALTKAASFHLDYAFLSGTGAGQPLGVLNAPCLVVAGKEIGQAASTIVYANLAKMYARLHPACIQNSVWVAHHGAVPYLLQLSVSVGTGGSAVPVLSERDGRFTLLGRPAVFTEKVPVLGQQGDIGLYDFSQYAIGLRREAMLDRSTHLGFSRDTVYYRLTMRVDGQPLWRQAYVPKTGDSMSPFVVLAERS